MNLAYIRVSTAEQNEARQVEAMNCICGGPVTGWVLRQETIMLSVLRLIQSWLRRVSLPLTGLWFLGTLSRQTNIIILFRTNVDLTRSGRKCNKKEKPFPTSLLAPMRRFERPTYCLGGSCSILLSYMGILVTTSLITHYHILSLKLKSCKAPILPLPGD